VIAGHRYPLPTADPSYGVDLAIAAVLAGEIGATEAGIGRALAVFRPGPHRREIVGEWDGVTWVDDSKATNPHAAHAAATSYASVVLIAGGRNKGLDLSGMVASTVRHLVAYGEAGRQIADAGGVASTVVEAFDDAVAAAAAVAVSGDVVLLAPGCASFDQFASYAERGDRFALLAGNQAKAGK
jgi:UDP-N-acetylmuramoylalanine--D-glutamate ligase